MTQQAPSKTELLERRAERELVREGKTVLEERRDLLAQLMLEQIALTEELNSGLGDLGSRVVLGFDLVELIAGPLPHRVRLAQAVGLGQDRSER